MANVHRIQMNTDVFKGEVSYHTGLFIDGKWVDPVDKGTIDVINPATGKVISPVAAGNEKDVDIAVAAARKAYKSSWGLKVPGTVRGAMINKLADLMQERLEELSVLESLNVGKPYSLSLTSDVPMSIATFRYYAGFADKLQGDVIETNELKLAYTRHEPYGVVGLITPWNNPITLLARKFGPALATGNCIVLKPSEITPLTALKVAELVNEAGFPPGVINVVNGYGQTVGAHMSSHPHIYKLSFTGSTFTGSLIQAASAKSNLKPVTLELGGKSPNIIFDDCDLEQSVKWSAKAIFANMGQTCSAGSRIFVQEGIYDKFVAGLTQAAKTLRAATGDPFAKVEVGGERHGSEGWFVAPTVFTNCKPGMRIVEEEIFGPVAVVIKFKTEEEAIEMANDNAYGLACGLFTENSARAIRVAHALEAGTAFVNCFNTNEKNVPLGGYKMSGLGRELGAAALEHYTQIKAVHINLGSKL